LGILLRIAAQVNALPQMVERREMLTPMMVDRLQHEAALELAQKLGPYLRLLALPGLVTDLFHSFAQRRIVELGLALQPFADGSRELVIGGERGLESRHVPLFLDRFRRNEPLERRIDLAADHVADGFGDIVAFEQLVAL